MLWATGQTTFAIETAWTTAERIAALRSGITGTVTIRVVDTNRAPGTHGLDTASIDEIWIRAVP